MALRRVENVERVDCFPSVMGACSGSGTIVSCAVHLGSRGMHHNHIGLEQMAEPK
jgi:hypothetical protein